MDVLVADGTEAGVRDVARDGGGDAGIEASEALRLQDVHHHAGEAELRAGEVGLTLEPQARLGDVDREGEALREHRRRTSEGELLGNAREARAEVTAAGHHYDLRFCV